MGTQPNVGSDSSEGSLPTHVGANGPQRESKLELFGFDSLVNILGLKRYVLLDSFLFLIFPFSLSNNIFLFNFQF